MCVFCILTASICNAAAAGTHLYFAQIWMDAYSSFDRGAFVNGTLFPDIRYLGTISRKKTHEKGLTAQKIRSTRCPFKAGMRLHSFLDERREYFVKKSGILSQMEKISKKQRVFFLKLLEDEILWSRIDTELARNSLMDLLDQEIDLADSQTVQKWHQLLLLYFEQKPTDHFSALIAKGASFVDLDSETMAAWIPLLQEYASHPKYINYVDRLIFYMMMQFFTPATKSQSTSTKASRLQTK